MRSGDKDITCRSKPPLWALAEYEGTSGIVDYEFAKRWMSRRCPACGARDDSCLKPSLKVPIEELPTGEYAGALRFNADFISRRMYREFRDVLPPFIEMQIKAPRHMKTEAARYMLVLFTDDPRVTTLVRGKAVPQCERCGCKHFPAKLPFRDIETIIRAQQVPVWFRTDWIVTLLSDESVVSELAKAPWRVTCVPHKARWRHEPPPTSDASGEQEASASSTVPVARSLKRSSSKRRAK